jgi:hypothetical protein
MMQKAGCIRIAGAEHEVVFEPAEGTVLGAVDGVYCAKYASSSYLS